MTMGLFGDTATTTQNTTVPWSPAQPYLSGIMGSAQQLYNSKQGFNAPNFQTYVPQSSQTQQALSQMQGIANQGNPLAGQSIGALQSQFAGGAMNNQYQNLYGQASAGN